MSHSAEAPEIFPSSSPAKLSRIAEDVAAHVFYGETAEEREFQLALHGVGRGRPPVRGGDVLAEGRRVSFRILLRNIGRLGLAKFGIIL